MPAPRVIKCVDALVNGYFCLCPGEDIARQTSSDFSVLNTVSTIALSKQLPWPLIDRKKRGGVGAFDTPRSSIGFHDPSDD